MHGGKIYIAQRPARIIRNARIDGATALILAAPPGYPGGGLLSGHLIVVWNQHGHGYFVSPHFATSPNGTRYRLNERIGAALALARSSRAQG